MGPVDRPAPTTAAPRPRVVLPTYGAMGLDVRCAAAGFALLVLLFGLLAQANLWVQAGGGTFPTPTAVLERYHGQPDSSRLHVALDPTQDEASPTAMYPFLGDNEAERQAHRRIVLGWVEDGAARAQFEPVRAILVHADRCAGCHVPDGLAAAVPLSTYEDVLEVARLDGGMPLPRLLVSAHAHLFSFAVAALLLSIGLLFVRGPPRLRVGLSLAAFVSPVLDIGGWLLTRSYGEPFHHLILLGGGLFGLATTAMAVWILWEALWGRPSGATSRGAARSSSAVAPVDPIDVG